MKKVLITGGNGDIAKAIEKELSQVSGYQVDMPGKDKLDVTDYSSVEAYMLKLRPDILINNAGYVVPHSISENEYISEKKTIDINLLGTFICTGVAAQLNKNIVVVNIGSSAGTKVHAEWGAYCAAKAGVIMATQCWAAEGLKVICVSPGRTQTKMRKSLFADEDPDTLLKPLDFGKIVVMAIHGRYEWGRNIDVNVTNIKELLNGK